MRVATREAVRRSSSEPQPQPGVGRDDTGSEGKGLPESSFRDSGDSFSVIGHMTPAPNETSASPVRFQTRSLCSKSFPP